MNGAMPGPGRDEDVGPLVVRLEQEPALRPDHPHLVPERQPPQQRREAEDRDEPDVELVAAVTGLARGRRHRVGPLDELAVGEDPDRQVLARLEPDRLALELDPEVGEVVGLVDTPDETGVVGLRLGVDVAGVVERSVIDRSPPGDWALVVRIASAVPGAPSVVVRRDAAGHPAPVYRAGGAGRGPTGPWRSPSRSATVSNGSRNRLVPVASAAPPYNPDGPM